MNIDIEMTKKNDRYTPHILEIIKRHKIPNITRVALRNTTKENEDISRILIIIFTKDYLTRSFIERTEELITKELLDFLNLDIFFIIIQKDPKID